MLEADERGDGNYHDGKQRQDDLPGEAGEIDHIEAGGHHQQSGAEVGLLGDQAHGHEEQHQRQHKVEPLDRALPFLEVPRQHQRHGDLHDLGGLDHHTDVEPAARALADQAEHGHRHQQGHADRIERHRHPHQRLGWQVSDDPHHQVGQQDVAQLVLDPAGHVDGGRVERHDAGGEQQEDDERERLVEAGQGRLDER